MPPLETQLQHPTPNCGDTTPVNRDCDPVNRDCDQIRAQALLASFIKRLQWLQRNCDTTDRAVATAMVAIEAFDRVLKAIEEEAEQGKGYVSEGNGFASAQQHGSTAPQA